MQAGAPSPLQPHSAEYLIHLTLFLNARHRVTFGSQVGPSHGHSWRVDLALRATFRDGPGETPVEFAELDRRVRVILRPYEGQFLNDLEPFDRVAPTTENLARLIFGRVGEVLAGTGVDAVQVSVWEAPTKGVTVASPLPKAMTRGGVTQPAYREAAAALEHPVQDGARETRREGGAGNASGQD